MSSTERDPIMPIYIDPRGPKTIIKDIKVDPNGGPMILTLACGHRIERANQFSYLIGSDHVVKQVTNFSYKIGDSEHCIQCKGRGIYREPSGGSRWVKR